MKVFSLLFCFLLCIPLSSHAAQRYAIARTATPVLNTSDFASVFGGKDGATLKTDRCGMTRELEFIALPGTVFSIVSEIHFGASTVYQVQTAEYSAPSGIKLYLEASFVEVRKGEPTGRTKILPSQQAILSRLQESVGNRYVWGGNISAGIPELNSRFYKETAAMDITAGNMSFRTLSGVDCSGLLYQATDGWTPRNTAQLVNYGQGLKINGKSADEITTMLKPLDLIVWGGHVVIVMGQETAIESRAECSKASAGGVMTTPLKRRLVEIMKLRKPTDQWNWKGSASTSFVIRRWFGKIPAQ